MRAFVTLMVCVAATVQLAAANLPCESDIDCQLNGACDVGSGVCACRAGWAGGDCGALDFLPAPTTHAFWRNDTASWGGSIVKASDEDGGQWHMFLAYIEGNCGLNAWQPNSAIYRWAGLIVPIFDVVEDA